MRHYFWSLLSTLVLVSGCGGGGDTLYGQQGGTSTVAAVSVTSSQPQIAPDDSTTATITATVRDSNNNFVKDATVVFTASAGGLVINQSKTDTSGIATATLRAAGAAPGTVITVSANVNGVSSSTTVTVLATTQTMTVTTSKTQIKSDGSDTATITAFLRGPSNQFLANVPVNFTSSSGGLSVSTATTDQNGSATTVLTSLPDPSNRTITVTATTGATTQTITIDVTGTTLTLEGPDTVIQGTQATYVARLTNAGQQPLSGRSVTLAASAANVTVVAPATRTTDAQGTISFTVTGASATTTPITLTASALGINSTHSVSVTNNTLIFTAPAANAIINLNQATPISVTWTENGAPVNAGQVSFSTTRGALTSPTALTNASGVATISIQSTGAGAAVISASTTTGLTAQVPVTFVATNPSSIVVQASPTNVPINTSSTVSAIVRDPAGNLVQGQIVDFTLTDTTGGSLSAGSSMTDSQGRAQTTYNASSATSAANGVSIVATVRGTAVTGAATLTVSGRTIFMSLGTGNTIFEPNSTQYYVEYTVQAIDTAGNPLVNQPITFSVHSLEYYKGVRYLNGPVWSTCYTLPPATLPVPQNCTTYVGTSCPNEDINLNGTIDGTEDSSANNNGRLDPGDIASVFPATVTTDATGSATVRVTYPQDHAYYLKVRLTATTTVQGTETSKTADFMLQGIATDYNQPTITPPGPTIPFGQRNTCSNTL